MLRLTLPSATLFMLGVEAIFGSFFLSLLGLNRAARPGAPYFLDRHPERTLSEQRESRRGESEDPDELHCAPAVHTFLPQDFGMCGCDSSNVASRQLTPPYCTDHFSNT